MNELIAWRWQAWTRQPQLLPSQQSRKLIRLRRRLEPELGSPGRTPWRRTRWGGGRWWETWTWFLMMPWESEEREQWEIRSKRLEQWKVERCWWMLMVLKGIYRRKMWWLKLRILVGTELWNYQTEEIINQFFILTHIYMLVIFYLELLPVLYHKIIFMYFQLHLFHYVPSSKNRIMW